MLPQLCADALGNGWTKFKVKVGADLEDDRRRCRLIREMIGPSNTLVRLRDFPAQQQPNINIPSNKLKVCVCQMMDANQRWDVAEAIRWVSSLADFRPLWIEEPTCPDDILGHAAISKVRENRWFFQLVRCQPRPTKKMLFSCRLWLHWESAWRQENRSVRLCTMLSGNKSLLHFLNYFYDLVSQQGDV